MVQPKPVILVTAAKGQVGHALLKALAGLGHVLASTLAGKLLSILGPVVKADLRREEDILRIVREVHQGFEKISLRYHLCNAGETSWKGFAEEIFRQVRALGHELAVQRVLPMGTADYPTPAKRPLNSRLDCRKFQQTFGTPALPSWQESFGETTHILLGA